MILLRLRVISDEDIRRQPAIGDDTAYCVHTVHIPLAGIFAVHELQYLIAAALHRQVDMLAHVWHLSDYLQCLVAHVLGVAGGKAHSHRRHLFCHSSEKFWEANVLCPCLPVTLEEIRIHVLSKQCNFLVSLVSQVAHLL